MRYHSLAGIFSDYNILQPLVDRWFILFPRPIHSECRPDVGAADLGEPSRVA